MVNRAYSDPEGDVEISSPYRGDIRCRKLVVTQTGSVVGNIEAHDVRNFGRIHGVVNASDVFINAEAAKVRGSVFAPHLGIHPNSVFEASGSNSRRFEVDQMSPVSTSAIETAVQEGIRRELAKRGMSSDDQGFNVSPDTTFSRPGPVEAVAAPMPAETVEVAQSHFRTPDGKERPLPPRTQEFVDLTWAPPARGKSVTMQSNQPRALPPLFATDK
ncbi:polymer-forming cytoskeletal protein [Pararhizobium sp. BT-229]|uniref:polymer-forming cytoskeletal protein n=1 Tax=Pararhizobium sp. BT-229 TaxID=2986923 RepID=UPI0021F7D167|nr:polymer-forming cytoskeletal protein [Pararhizobium sp. BT-229]MCV9963593.1 polymer-forming cytoskeletal protein [Pararhizobium sp. BT-229]